MSNRYVGKKQRSPVKAIREMCIECVARTKNYNKLIKECPDQECNLYKFRFGKNPNHTQNLTAEEGEKQVTPVKAIRMHCTECMGGTKGYSKQIKECPTTVCPVYDYRFGENPNHRQNLTDKERKERADRLKKNVLGKQCSGKIAQISIISPTPIPKV